MFSSRLLIVVLLLVCSVLAVSSKPLPGFKCLSDCKAKSQKNGTPLFKCFKLCRLNSKKNRKRQPEVVQEPLSESTYTSGINSEALWDRYRQSLFYFLKRTSNGDEYRGMQMVTDQNELNWHKYPEHLAIFTDRVSRYGSTFEPTPLSFNKEYEKFLTNLDILDSSAGPSFQKEKDNLVQEIDDAGYKLETAEMKCRVDYEQMKPYLGSKPYGQFESEFCPTVSNLQFQMKRLNGRYAELRTKINGNYADAFFALDKYLTARDKGQYTDYSQLDRFVTNAKKGQAQKFSVAVRSETQVNEKREWTKKKKSGFLMFKKKKTTTRVEYRMQEEYFQMDISAQGYGAIKVYPSGNWFSASTTNKYRSSVHYLNKNLKFFGEGGSMSLLPHTYHVLYRPKVKLSVSKRDGLTFMENTQSSFSFGPFNSNKQSTMDVKKVNENNYLVEFNINSDEPILVAVENHLL